MNYSRIAHLYDSLLNFDADLPFFVEECLSASGTVLELMAGTGRVTAELVKSGLRPTCVDFSREMLAHLAKKTTAASRHIVCADVRDLPFAHSFSLAILPFNSLCELVSDEARHTALDSVRAALAPRGRFICTLYNPAFRIKSVTPQRQVTARFPNPTGCGEVLFSIASEYDADRGVVSGTQTFTTIDDGEVVEEISIPVEFCLPTQAWFAEAARANGFTVEALFGDYDRSEYHPESSPFLIWFLKKNAA
ncbi:MAG: class I SAM-dependent methyltransferase [bacterium]|nr:class I SAM-dependent methyltransferase [bacterium]